MKTIVTEKRCPRCKSTKPIAFFGLSKNRNDGHDGWCKDCRNNLWRSKHPKKVRSKQPIEKRKAYLKDWFAKYYAKNKEALNARARAHYHNNKEAYRKKNAEWRKKYPEKLAAIKNNRRAAELSAEGSFLPKEWKDLVLWCNNKCLRCGKEGVTVDHVIPLSKGGTNYISNIQPLCYSCNSGKKDRIADYRC